jgi:hypothetical protein
VKYDCNIFVTDQLNRAHLSEGITHLYEEFDRNTLNEFENVIFVVTENNGGKLVRKALDVVNSEVEVFHIEGFFQPEAV